jgi:hypothetical protein
VPQFNEADSEHAPSLPQIITHINHFVLDAVLRFSHLKSQHQQLSLHHEVSLT